jgi:DNA-binding transcriptional regulator YhcF (GntR family)
MFVAGGAKARLIAKRRDRFSAEFLAPLLAEAEKLGVTPQQLKSMIDKEGTK